ncbi:MAG TPA: selenocysteine-specific translation elongation factor [Casimicrobiaceae bacterium]|nr:selenocysteine-specific translation elongation factor [Casimicrobiaceae bacterium]
MIVATAGHIDHGKTRLVKALTGVDTDRLPEERARGISIDLGFAHADIGSHERVSFIDVPGHERFVRNMLAGVCSIDTSLLVVAADDGVMPQTREHLQILDLLDVRSGAVVITKTDLASPQRVDEVCADVQAALGGTSLANAPAFPVSTVSGAGVRALEEWLRRLADAQSAPADDQRYFRIAVDRSFSVSGSGTVITGTVQSGTVTVGDQLIVSPAGRKVRVRAVQVQGKPASRAMPAQRCALNLAGATVDEVQRGDWVLHPAVHAPTSRLDVRLDVSSHEESALVHWTPVHLHLGTAHVLARVTVSAEGAVAPGATALAQLVLERPIGALHGDRFVIRDQSARRTIGGGTVLDPFAPKRHRRARLRNAELQMLQRVAPAAILSGLLEISEGGVAFGAFARSLNLTPDRLAEVQESAQAIVLGKETAIAISRASAEVMATRVISAVRDFHAAHPRSIGIEVAALHVQTAPRLPAPAFAAFVRDLAERKSLVLANDIVRLRDHETTANAEDERLWHRVRQSLADGGVQAPLVADLAKKLGVQEPALRDFLLRKSRTRAVMRVGPERFCLRETLARVAATAAAVAAASKSGRFTAAQFRDAIGTGRALAIHYLELFDRLGITLRVGDARCIGKSDSMSLGSAAPLTEKEALKHDG